MAGLATLRSDALTVVASTHGAEIQSIVDADGRDWLWDGDARWWTGRAPILFPTIGISAGGVARFGDRVLAMAKHGFARDSDFILVEGGEDRIAFRLEASDATRAMYPFEFQLDVSYRLADSTISFGAVVSNLGDEAIPAGFGFHPALRWPLPGTGAASRDRHFVRFDADEPEALREIDGDGLFLPTVRPTPVRDNELHLRDALFTHDALVWDAPVSRGLYYGVEGHPGVRVDFPEMRRLGIWTKPGAGFLCIEPWHSRADDEGYDGQFADKPGVVTIAPGKSHHFAMALTIGVPVD